MYILGLPLVEALLVRLVGLANGGRNRRWVVMGRGYGMGVFTCLL